MKSSRESIRMRSIRMSKWLQPLRLDRPQKVYLDDVALEK